MLFSFPGTQRTALEPLSSGNSVSSDLLWTWLLLHGSVSRGLQGKRIPWFHYYKPVNFTSARLTFIHRLLVPLFVLGLHEDFSLIVNIGQLLFSSHLCKTEKNKVGILTKSHRNDFYWQAVLIVFFLYFATPSIFFLTSPSSNLTFVVLWENTKINK